ncbi:lysine--tRNA ligase [Oceanibacterium hippocampi]|uniref:Lysine--tRNA ligase n=1 Tax=Oceanibacterium hippocampi TaxID=745714 RepID=A0A1Y5RCS3_9PROT|nr:lysine--tRNA ligase [Oceanibacterium hippocampi]SLN11903.1 Lysine--tRNA ligase [Oceanibacterium hippocampi]
MTTDAEYAMTSNAWPFQEAAKLVKRYSKAPPAKGYVLFETGYGPSGLPHIGTFGEVARTSMVRRALAEISDLPTRLFAFSDDMDGLRKVPGNVPNQEMLTRHLDLPLTKVPDPFEKFESFGHHNNAMLRSFLDQFGFEYEFRSSTECYHAGEFDNALLEVLKHYDAIMAIMLPSLREERQKSYSPFLPVCPRTGKVLQVPILEARPDSGTVLYADPESGETIEVPVTGGQCKLQWKADWAMRWYALNVDYEMSGKDLIDSVKLSSRICQVLGAPPPDGFNYELFLDEDGKKISKSKGNGLTIDDWLTYASPESLSLYMFQSPRKAKRLYFDVIPKAVDEYYGFLERFPGQEKKQQYANPVWHIHAGNPPSEGVPFSFGILLNLAAVVNAEESSVLWGFISRYVPGATAETHPEFDRLVGYAIAYYRDFVKPTKAYRTPTEVERSALNQLAAELRDLDDSATAEEIQNRVYEVGKEYDFENLRDWFQALYEVLLGQSQGPRMGSFIALYGRAETIALIERALAGEDLSVPAA